MERLCLDCHSPLKGRADKKFCDDQCRSNYNNHLQTENHGFLKQVNQILKKNRAILKSKSLTGKDKVKRSLLLAKGYDFNFHTHTYAAKNGNTYTFCYEYGYLFLTNEELLLVKRNENWTPASI